MMAKPMKTLDLHYPMIQFLKTSVSRPFHTCVVNGLESLNAGDNRSMDLHPIQLGEGGGGGVELGRNTSCCFVLRNGER